MTPTRHFIDDRDDTQRALHAASPEAWEALLDLVMPMKDSPDDEVGEEAVG